MERRGEDFVSNCFWACEDPEAHEAAFISFNCRYFTDSLVNRIWAYDCNDGQLANRRLFVDCLALGLPEGTFPDGLCIDSDGGLWSAR